jgi:hypothetical protein
MQTVLINFGDAPRVVHDKRNRAITVLPGQMKSADINDAHYAMLKRGTFMALPEEVVLPARVQDAMTLMGVVDTEEYDDLLKRFGDIAGRDPLKLRPTRDMIRLALRDIAQNAMAEIGVGARAAGRVTIHEEGDEVTRNNEDEERAPPVREPEPKPPVEEPRQKNGNRSQPRAPQTNRPKQHVRAARA